jgi:DNA polymerase-3 subunit epsilon
VPTGSHETDAQAVAGAEPGPTEAELERMRKALEGSGLYRVVRRLRPRTSYTDEAALPTGARTYKGLYVDTETTGLDARSQQVIELGMLEFDYDAGGNIYGVREVISALEDPGRPLPQEVVDLTGITDADVKGQRFDDALVNRAVGGADLIVAHNASFDRPFLEQRFEAFRRRPWACSVRDVDWRDLGYASSSLEYLAFRRGFYFEAHRAITDCWAGLELLAEPLADGEPPAMRLLHLNAQRRSVRLWAAGSPIAKKDLLKARGYRFNGASKVWWRDVPRDGHDEELAWLAGNIYGRRVPLPYLEVSALERYSDRVPESLPPDAQRR